MRTILPILNKPFKCVWRDRFQRCLREWHKFREKSHKELNLVNMMVRWWYLSSFWSKQYSQYDPCEATNRKATRLMPNWNCEMSRMDSWDTFRSWAISLNIKCWFPGNHFLDFLDVFIPWRSRWATRSSQTFHDFLAICKRLVTLYACVFDRVYPP